MDRRLNSEYLKMEKRYLYLEKIQKGDKNGK